ncbi:MAG: hypothetical protein AB9858_06340 [Acidaminococcaceae bacterium]
MKKNSDNQQYDLIEDSNQEISEIKKQARRESANYYDALPVWFKSILAQIPYIGSTIDDIMSQKAVEYYRERIETLFYEVNEEIRRIDKSKINKKYFETEEGFELIRKAIEYSSKTIDRDKILEYARIIRSAADVEFSPKIRHLEIIDIFFDMTMEQIVILRAIKIARDRGELEIKGYGKSIEDLVPSELKDDLLFYIKKIESLGLLTEKTGAILSYSGGTYSLTPTGIKLLEHIKYLNS